MCWQAVFGSSDVWNRSTQIADSGWRIAATGERGRLADLLPVDARRGRRIVPVLAPRRLAEMNHEVAVVRDDGVVEGQRANATPVAKGPALFELRPARLPVVGELDVEGQSALRRRVPRSNICAMISSRKSSLSPAMRG